MEEAGLTRDLSASALLRQIPGGKPYSQGNPKYKGPEAKRKSVISLSLPLQSFPRAGIQSVLFIAVPTVSRTRLGS